MSFYNCKKVLVTGGTGLIGRPLLDLLLEAKANITCVSLDSPNDIDDKINFINKDLRNFFAQPIEHWIGNFLSSTTLSINGYQASAIQDQGSVDPETQTNNRSRAIFNKMLQLFQSGDLITNERLETDFDTAESRNEFGIWITRSGKSWGQPIYSSTDPFFLNPITGEAREIPIDIIVNRIRNRLGLNNNFEFKSISSITAGII